MYPKKSVNFAIISKKLSRKKMKELDDKLQKSQMSFKSFFINFFTERRIKTTMIHDDSLLFIMRL
jgi:hypothetical protein